MYLDVFTLNEFFESPAPRFRVGNVYSHSLEPTPLALVKPSHVSGGHRLLPPGYWRLQHPQSCLRSTLPTVMHGGANLGPLLPVGHGSRLLPPQHPRGLYSLSPCRQPEAKRHQPGLHNPTLVPSLLELRGFCPPLHWLRPPPQTHYPVHFLIHPHPILS